MTRHKSAGKRRASTPRARSQARNPAGRGLVMLVVVVLAVFVARTSWSSLASGVRSISGYRAVEQHASIIRAAARESRVDPNLLAGIMLAESSGRVDAVSGAGALGLFQLMLPTARERAALLGLEEPSRADLLRDAELNTRLAANYVRWLDKRYHGNLEQMLIAYNAGPGKLERWIQDAGGYAAWRSARESAGDSQVLDYARKVTAYRERFAQRGVVAPAFDQPSAQPPKLREAPTLSTTSVPYGPPALPSVDGDAAPELDGDS